MTPAVRKTFHNLVSALSLAVAQKSAAGILSAEDADIVNPLIEALSHERFHFEAEIWHGTKDEGDTASHHPAEMLLRAFTPDLKPIAPLAPITIIAQIGLHNLLDKAIIISAIDQALEKNQMPISVNTSARNLRTEDFWLDFHALLDDHFAQEDISNNLTIEVTEDDIAHNPCREMLLNIKDKYECKFAIDDFYYDYAQHRGNQSGIESFDWERLENLKQIVDFVKIDGVIVEESLADIYSLKLQDVIRRVHGIVPHAHFVFERVADADEALRLGDIVSAQTNSVSMATVQGRSLADDRAKFYKELIGATHNFPPRPKTPGR